MAKRTFLRPTGFVDSPFGHDGQVARLAGGLGWFATVELIQVLGGPAKRRLGLERIAAIEEAAGIGGEGHGDDIGTGSASVTPPAVSPNSSPRT